MTEPNLQNIIDLIESQSAELHSMNESMQAGFDRIEAATHRNTDMLASGSRAVAVLNRWNIKRDALDRKRDARIAALEKDVRRLKKLR